MSKDFTDDIYDKNFEANWFVPDSSEMFANLLVVVPTAKLQEFRANYASVIDSYYSNLDKTDKEKIHEVAANKLKAMKEADTEEW